jgi:hypothetical protein
LDWRKAFDSIDPAALLDALRRFGLPLKFRQAVEAIYTDRVFIVTDSGQTSQPRRQMSGICQGCPLSQFLFIIVMSIIMHDSIAKLGETSSQAYNKGALYDILYADDTLLIGTSATNVAEFAEMVEKTGAQYGMTLHWGKTQAMSMGTNDCIVLPGGTDIQSQSSLQYLGAVISSDGRLDSEVSRKIGAAKADFHQLAKLWSHANVPTKDKLKFFHALVASKLQYGLSSMWLVTAQRRRLDGFYARCLRKILRIQPAYYSRVPNARVFELSEVRPFTQQLLQKQLVLLGKVARSPASSTMRRILLHRARSFLRLVGLFAASDARDKIGRTSYSSLENRHWKERDCSNCLPTRPLRPSSDGNLK